MSKDDREAVKKRMAKAKARRVSFDDFFSELEKQYPELKKATAYGWWNAAGDVAEPKSEGPKGKGPTPISNPSEELANLLRKEGVLQGRVAKARSELAAVQGAIRGLWEAREKSIGEALSDK
jgi:hypothetical protein